MCNAVALSIAPLLLLIFLASFGRHTQAIVCSYKGERHSDGDRWIVRSAFVVECHVFSDGSWRVDIVACLTPKGIEMHDGDELVEDDVKLQCTKIPSGAYRLQRNYIIRNFTCEGHVFGEWWISNRNFNKTCTPSGTHIMNCLTDIGIPLKLNSIVTISGIRYNCIDHRNGTVSLTREFLRNPAMVAPRGPIHCIANGMRKQPGETWIESTNFIKKCDERGAIIIKACVADGSIIDLNSNFTQNGKMYFCTRGSNGTVFFTVAPINTMETN